MSDGENVGEGNGVPKTSPQRCGFIAVIGAPNAGKSTLVNALVGAKVSIVSRKVQTTRVPVRGMATEGDSQLVFIDTPGLFTPTKRLDRAMVDAAWSGAKDADLAVLLIEQGQARILAWRAGDGAAEHILLRVPLQAPCGDKIVLVALSCPVVWSLSAALLILHEPMKRMQISIIRTVGVAHRKLLILHIHLKPIIHATVEAIGVGCATTHTEHIKQIG